MKFFNSSVILCNLLITLWFKVGTIEAIVGGVDAEIDQFKFMVSVQSNYEHICGGTIVGRLHVITAASCLIDEHDNFINEKFTISVGMVNFKSLGLPGLVADVQIIYVPKKFVRKHNNQNYIESGDIAVIQIKEKLEYLEYFNSRLIKIPRAKHAKHSSSHYGEVTLLIGFGLDTMDYGAKRNRENFENYNNHYGKLKYMHSEVIHKRACKVMFPFTVDNGHLCGQTMIDSKKVGGACVGDIGGPIILRDTVIGVLIRPTENCRENSAASLYTNVSTFKTFINNAILGKKLNTMRVANYQVKNSTDNSSAATIDLIEIVTDE